MICAIDDDGRLVELCRDVGVDEEKTLVRVDGLELGLARETEALSNVTRGCIGHVMGIWHLRCAAGGVIPNPRLSASHTRHQRPSA
jgi:hypothetical protein